jgi:flavin-dependent dehydrogenase
LAFMDSMYDVAIIGGGPAGSTAAIVLARKGRKVVVLEKEKFPRFHIGESLLPASMDAFERLGLREKMDARFMPKFGAEISTACGTSVVRNYFKDGLRARHQQAYQVTRSEFDKLLLDTAAESGAEVREQTLVERLEFDDEGVSLSIKGTGGSEALRARYVLDCSGRHTVVGQYFKLKKSYDNLNKFSVFAHYENVGRDKGIEGTFIRLITDRDRWFWMIPLTETRTSIGMVMDITTFKALKKTPEAALQDSLREQPMIWSRMGEAKIATQVHSAGDYSYRNMSLTGERWLLAGDAAGFIDPIFSTGVFLGLKSGEDAANTLHEVLSHSAARAVAFRKYERNLKRVMNLYLRFVNNWYKPQFAEVITRPAQRFQLAATINTVLAGNLSTNFSVWWRMQLFYLVVFLQRYVPLCPRVPMLPRRAGAES